MASFPQKLFPFLSPLRKIVHALPGYEHTAHMHTHIYIPAYIYTRIYIPVVRQKRSYGNMAENELLCVSVLHYMETNTYAY